MPKHLARVRRAAHQNAAHLRQALAADAVVYGAVPTETVRGNHPLGTWNFYRGRIDKIKAKRNWYGLVVDTYVTMTTDKGQQVKLLGSQVRYRGAEAYKSTSVSFEVVAMNVNERLRARRDKLSQQVENKTRRPYDFNYSEAQRDIKNLTKAVDAIADLPGEIEQIADCIRREFDYPQLEIKAPGNTLLYNELLEESMGRLPFYDQLALYVLAGWNSPYQNESANRYYPSWQHKGDYIYCHLTNIVEIAAEKCAVGPDATENIALSLSAN